MHFRNIEHLFLKTWQKYAIIISRNFNRAVFLCERGIILDKEKEKQDTEFYRNEIVRMINNIDNTWRLDRILRFIIGITK